MKPRDDRHGPPRVMASAPSVVQQARLMDAAGTAWHAVKCGNLEMITKLFPNQCNVYAKGPVGENVMHVAMLLNTPSTLAITRYMVKLYGTQLVNCPIQERRQQHDPPGTYEGQTALHIAIVNRDFDMVKFLVQNGANIRARAFGTFFRQDGPMYYGEFPLSFAACTGQKDVVAYLKRHGAQVNSDCDESGNTALHLCVIHSQPDMYDFLVDYCAASDAVRNYQGLTPLVLAAQLGKPDMLQHIYNRRRRAFYSFGKVTSYSLALREIDTVQDEDDSGASGPDGGYVPNALEAVLRKRHLDMLQEPLLSTLLQHKWASFARAQFIIHFAGYLLLEISQTILIWLHSDPDEWNGPARASQEVLGILLALIMLAVEVFDYANWSRECYHRRLTMTVHKEIDPPLYPIPGEMRDARDGRQSLFARLSARMGFAGSGSIQNSYSGPHGRSEGGLGTPRATSYPGAGQSVQLKGNSTVSEAPGTPVGASDSGSVLAPLRTPTTTPAAVQKVQLQQQALRRGLSGVSADNSPASGALSPTRSGQQFYRKSHDDPIDLRPRIGEVIGEGRSPQGEAVVDTGYTGGAEGGVTAADAAGSNLAAVSLPGRSSRLATTSRPLGEAREDEMVPNQQQQQQQHPSGSNAVGEATAGVGFSRLQRGSGTGDLFLSQSSSRDDDDDDAAFDVVSVGLRSGRMRSHIDLATISTGDGAHVHGAGARSVTFSDSTNVLGRAASGRVSGTNAAIDRSSGTGSPRPLLSSLQPLQQQQQQGASVFMQPGMPAAAAADGVATGGELAYGAALNQQEMLRGSGGSRNFDGSSPGPSTAPGGDPNGIPSSSGALGGTPAAPVSSSGAASSESPFGRVPSIARAKSFHGINAGLAGVSSVGGSSSGGGGGGAAGHALSMSRAQTAGDELNKGLATSSTPANPLEAVQMLERQRTRVRSGGGDLPAAHALKRTAPSNKPKPSSVLGTKAVVTDTSADGGGGPGEGRDGSASAIESVSFKADPEKGPVAEVLDPHKSRMRAMLETTYEGAMRMLEDPWLFVWHLHLLLTCMHFLTWVSSYGGIGGSGPKNISVREFDDVIVSLMGVTGWLAVIYFFRGLEATGKLAVVLERCIVDVLKFVTLYVLWNLGFTLAFYTMQNGVLKVAPNGISRDTRGIVELSQTEPDPFSSIGNTMITLINLGTGLSYYEYAMTCKTSFVLSMVVCTLYYLVYMATVVLLLLNLLIAMIIHTWNSTRGPAELYWRHRWAIYVIKAERRLPARWVQRLRLGQLAWDPVCNKPVYSHVFETVDDGKTADSSKTAADSQVKAIESLLEDLKKRRSTT